MTLYINGRFLTQATTGVQRYAIELVSAFDRLMGAGERGTTPLSFKVLTPPGQRQALYLEHIPVVEVGRYRGHLWEQLELPLHTRGGFLLNLCNTGPLAKRNQIVTIHDAAVFAVPRVYSLAFRTWYKFLLPRLGKVARSVVTDSEHSKKELVRFGKVPESRIRVVHLGGEQAQRQTPDITILERSDLAGKPYILTVSSLDPRKNFALLVQALELLGTQDYEIVVAGGTNPRVFQSSHADHLKHVKYLGYVSDGELRSLYEHATCFIYPSLYEGFGLPPLEAMVCGCPVIVSDAASLPEVCGDAALYCDPNDPADIADKIRRLMHDPELRDELRSKGLKQARKFSWEKCARGTLEVIDQVLSA
jgi:glycosyltransferase involved in cell wall biosynthesis